MFSEGVRWNNVEFDVRFFLDREEADLTIFNVLQLDNGWKARECAMPALAHNVGVGPLIIPDKVGVGQILLEMLNQPEAISDAQWEAFFRAKTYGLVDPGEPIVEEFKVLQLYESRISALQAPKYSVFFDDDIHAWNVISLLDHPAGLPFSCLEKVLSVSLYPDSQYFDLVPVERGELSGDPPKRSYFYQRSHGRGEANAYVSLKAGIRPEAITAPEVTPIVDLGSTIRVPIQVSDILPTDQVTALVVQDGLEQLRTPPVGIVAGEFTIRADTVNSAIQAKVAYTRLGMATIERTGNGQFELLYTAPNLPQAVGSCAEVWIWAGLHGQGRDFDSFPSAPPQWEDEFATMPPNARLTRIQIPLGPLDLVLIPAGTFTAGLSAPDPCWPELGTDRPGTFLPTQDLAVDAFFMGINEVTNDLWEEVAAWGVQNGYQFNHYIWDAGRRPGNHPVVNVGWPEAVRWCNARSEKEGLVPVYYESAAHTNVYRTDGPDSIAFGRFLTESMVKWSANGYRLPREVEWEYAARGGHNGRRFPWGNLISHAQANYQGSWHVDDRCQYDLSLRFHPDFRYFYGSGVSDYPGDAVWTSPVGSFAPNEFGLYDMVGNVWESCWDLYLPSAIATNLDRVVRGGSWTEDAAECQVAYRGWNRLSSGPGNGGFRLARSMIQSCPQIEAYLP